MAPEQGRRPLQAAAPLRIALIHGFAASMAPANAAFERLWPAPLRMNLLDDSLAADLERCGGVPDAALYGRFVRLADYASASGAQALVFTCSAFGACIDALVPLHPGKCVLKPNDALLQMAVDLPQPLGLLASFAPTLASMPAEFPPQVTLRTALAVGALEALQRGDRAAHDQAVVDAARELVQQGCRAIALAQISLAHTAEAVRQATGLPVVSTLESTVELLRAQFEGGQTGGIASPAP